MADGEWTLSTLKELFETQLAAEHARHDAMIELLNAKMEAAAEALRLKSDADKIHFESLNHENLRIAEASNKSVNREAYQSDKDAFAERISKVEQAAIQQTGKREGVGFSTATIVQVLQTVGLIIAILIGATTIFSGPRALPVSNPVTFAPGTIPLTVPPAQK